MMSTIKVDMEVKAGLQLFKKVERESFNDAIKRVIYLALENNECFVNEQEKKAIMNAVRSVEEGRTQSFKQMMKNIQKKRMAMEGKRGANKLNPGGKYPGKKNAIQRD